MSYLEKFEHELESWPEVSVYAHRFGGREFRFRSAEIGHVHTGGILDIPFPRSIHDAVLSEGLAQEHRWVANSGWVTFRIHNDHDFHLGIWLLRISYLRYALKTVPNPRKMFKRETQELHLSPRFKSLLEPFIPRSGKETSHEPAPGNQGQARNATGRCM